MEFNSGAGVPTRHGLLAALSIAWIASSVSPFACAVMTATEPGTAKSTPAQASAAPAASRRNAFDESQYKKASELSVRPSPIDEIRIPSPDKAVARSTVTTKVTLFVDEKGTVRNIAFDEAALAQPFRDAVRSAFAKARFKPGRIDDKPVKSRMRIEVTFEPNKPTNSAAGSVNSSTARR